MMKLKTLNILKNIKLKEMYKMIWMKYYNKKKKIQMDAKLMMKQLSQNQIANPHLQHKIRLAKM